VVDVDKLGVEEEQHVTVAVVIVIFPVLVVEIDKLGVEWEQNVAVVVVFPVLGAAHVLLVLLVVVCQSGEAKNCSTSMSTFSSHLPLKLDSDLLLREVLLCQQHSRTSRYEILS